MTQMYVEVVPRTSKSGDLAPRIPTPELFNDRIDEIGDSIGEIAIKLRDRLERALPPQPQPRWGLDEIELKFSLDLESEAGVIVARASAKAGFEVTLTWKAA